MCLIIALLVAGCCCYAAAYANHGVEKVVDREEAGGIRGYVLSALVEKVNKPSFAPATRKHEAKNFM